jgi:hypothetical protein
MQVIVTQARNTALDYRYSGVWGRCWMEPGPNFLNNFNNIVNSLVSQWDFAIVVLNETGPGGCGGGSIARVTLASDWQTIAHEGGHAFGNLADEYFNTGNAYTGAEPGAPNATINLNTLKWGQFVNPSTTLPTVFAQGMDPNLDVGAFEGAIYCDTGIYRPCYQCRMRNHNNNPFCPICYNHMRETLDPFHDYTYQNSYKGDFDGDGLQDLLIHNANSIAIYRSNGTQLEPMWSITGEMYTKPGDKFFVGDFNNDGLDDVYRFNTSDWQVPYFDMIKSNGTSGLVLIKMYELELPGWDDMRKHDEFFVSDFNGDGKEDIIVFNGRDWDVAYLGMLKSTGTKLVGVKLYEEELPGWDDMRKHDKFHVADFNNDGKDDLYVFNGKDWAYEYMGMLKSKGNKLQMVKVFEDSIPGWGAMAPNDEFYMGDIDGDGRDDLYAYNAKDWATEYLGLLKSTGNNLGGVMYADLIGSWNLGVVDKIIVGDFDNDGDEEVYIRNDNWLGMLRSNNGNSLNLIKIYPKWIVNFKYHQFGWW